MKKVIILFLIIVPVAGLAQKKPLQILFDITSKDTLTHQAVLRHVSGMSAAYPDAKLEVVVYGGAFPMVFKNKSSAAHTVQELAQKENVSFKMCAVSMKRFGVDESDLVDGVEVVPDAIIEIVTKQGEGWGYIKESHN
jgi:intracellular sulfur oxidation DsrE/DsrF family protein